jgi:hypothetical protein
VSVKEQEVWITLPQTVVRFVVKSQVTNQFRTNNYSVLYDSECLQNFVFEWGSRVQFLAGAGNCSGAHAASYTMGAGGYFSGDKAAVA